MCIIRSLLQMYNNKIFFINIFKSYACKYSSQEKKLRDNKGRNVNDRAKLGYYCYSSRWSTFFLRETIHMQFPSEIMLDVDRND